MFDFLISCILIHHDRNIKVGSSQGFISTQGVILAKPYRTGAIAAKARSQSTGRSEYLSQFAPKRYNFCINI